MRFFVLILVGVLPLNDILARILNISEVGTVFCDCVLSVG